MLRQALMQLICSCMMCISIEKSKVLTFIYTIILSVCLIALGLGLLPVVDTT